MTGAAAGLTLPRPAAQPTALQDGLWLVAALLGLLAWEAGGLDLPLVRLYGNAEGFFWREHWWTRSVLHDGARALAWLLLGLLVWGLRWPLPIVRTLSQRERVWLLATMLLCVALIPLLKRASWTSCPWSLVEFGGTATHYVPHWLLAQRDGGDGGCFPSGHASTAFAFLAGWFVLRQRTPRVARGWLIITVAAGLLLGWVQMMRGAHYLSHSLWTAWFCWAVSAVSFHCAHPWRLARAAIDPLPV